MRHAKKNYVVFFCFFFCEVIVVGLLFLITFFTFNTAHIPVESTKCSANSTLISSEEITALNEQNYYSNC